MRARLRGEDYAQLDNNDPFAPPAYRSPVYRTPEPVIWLVQLLRVAWHTLRFFVRHPLLDLTAAAAWYSWRLDGWPGPVILAGITLAALVLLRVCRPDWFARLVSGPARNRWRWWRYRLRWHGVLAVAGLAPRVDGRLRVPVLGKVRSSACTDLVLVGLVSGQAPEAFAGKTPNLAHGFGALSCRVRTGPPGSVVLELVRRDSLVAGHSG